MKREKKFLHSEELILNFLIYDNLHLCTSTLHSYLAIKLYEPKSDTFCITGILGVEKP